MMKEISLHILDIAQNSLEAGAMKIEISIKEEWHSEVLNITVADDGKGMSRERLQSVTDPFFTGRKSRKVGLGIPLLMQHAEQTGGDIIVESEVGKGTTVNASFIYSHPDCQPMGDIAGAVLLIAQANPNLEMEFNYSTPRGKYCFDMDEVKNVLGIERIDSFELREQLRELILNSVESLKKKD